MYVNMCKQKHATVCISYCPPHKGLQYRPKTFQQRCKPTVLLSTNLNNSGKAVRLLMILVASRGFHVLRKIYSSMNHHISLIVREYFKSNAWRIILLKRKRNVALHVFYLASFQNGLQNKLHIILAESFIIEMHLHEYQAIIYIYIQQVEKVTPVLKHPVRCQN